MIFNIELKIIYFLKLNALMCQITCALCKIRIDETKWKEHITSTSHLQNCKNVDYKIAVKIYEMIFAV